MGIDGKIWDAQLREDWEKDQWPKLLGRVTDFEAAYNQIRVNLVHECFGIRAVLGPDWKTKSLEP